MKLYDAHNHLQDERLKPHLREVMEDARKAGVVRMVVNGSCESDWAEVAELSGEYPEVIPSFGYHPWYVQEHSQEWLSSLLEYLDRSPVAMGEIGLDRWIENPDLELQEELFLAQLKIAAERNLPTAIHCLRHWGRLYELLRNNDRPERGFLLHSYGGSPEMVKQFLDLGAYFSMSGYFAHDRKAKQREAFKEVPMDRLLLETDAPDMHPPDAWNRHLLKDESGARICHPASLKEVYAFASEFLEIPSETLAKDVEQNFLRFFEGS